MSVSWFIDGQFHPGPAYGEPLPPGLVRGKDRLHEGEHITVGAIMTESPLTAEIGDTCDAALEALEEEEFHHLPVTSDDGVLVGLVSDRDLLRDIEAKVGEVMTSRVLVGDPETDLQVAAQALIEERFHSLVVIDESQRPVGILTSYDVLSFLVRHPAYELWSR
jgi:acetoin utilization protein AcuB